MNKYIQRIEKSASAASFFDEAVSVLNKAKSGAKSTLKNPELQAKAKKFGEDSGKLAISGGSVGLTGSYVNNQMSKKEKRELEKIVHQSPPQLPSYPAIEKLSKLIYR